MVIENGGRGARSALFPWKQQATRERHACKSKCISLGAEQLEDR